MGFLLFWACFWTIGLPLPAPEEWNLGGDGAPEGAGPDADHLSDDEGEPRHLLSLVLFLYGVVCIARRLWD